MIGKGDFNSDILPVAGLEYFEDEVCGEDTRTNKMHQRIRLGVGKRRNKIGARKRSRQES